MSSSKIDDGIDALERGEHLGALGFGIDRPAGSLVAPHRRVGVHADDERVAERARLPQVADVAGMEDVEHAVGEDDRGPVAAAGAR